MKIKLVPTIFLFHGKAVQSFHSDSLFSESDPVKLAGLYSNSGADELLVFDLSDTDEEHDEAIGCIREICRNSQLPVAAAGRIRRTEDVKKILYAGCAAALLNGSKDSGIELLEEVSKRFGRDKIRVSLSDAAHFRKHEDLIERYADSILLMNGTASELPESKVPVFVMREKIETESIKELLSAPAAGGITGRCMSEPGTDLISLKCQLQDLGLETEIMTSALSWADFKKDACGLVPCIVQDYRSDEVLMMAWMNEESFEKTLQTGRMCYYSRSRQAFWMKGETSGHFQYVKSLKIDCDRDTILAKVSQVGAACHTGNRSCFYTELASKKYNDTNPYRVFEDVMNVILDRKVHPKEGSYTNYLFDKGIDKILKKVGEENTEIIIAAKNPDPEEIKYEIADYLYHLMVLMADKGVTWEEITDELARR